MKPLVLHLMAVLGATFSFTCIAADASDVIHLKCKIPPSAEYVIRIDPAAEVMWVHGTRLKLQQTETEYLATEYPGEPTELKAEYRINRHSSVLRRTSYGLNGSNGAREGSCRKSEARSAHRGK